MIFLNFLILLFASHNVLSESHCDAGWTLNSDYCFKVFSHDPANYQKAGEVCSQNHAILAPINGPDDIKNLLELKDETGKATEEIWVGLFHGPMANNSKAFGAVNRFELICSDFSTPMSFPEAETEYAKYWGAVAGGYEPDGVRGEWNSEMSGIFLVGRNAVESQWSKGLLYDDVWSLKKQFGCRRKAFAGNTKE
ncbi:hypothetical protein DdX_19362 [Ditylenchus destructor]|uniref:C-type lectin domain-containing protein n=1 Tax=Ditylenchus destructor TaxID=166010 RepID=A0AAD4MJ05_9BILA|nr:hypothetical protein DdX_19362 [Ditylenchus destructor]